MLGLFKFRRGVALAWVLAACAVAGCGIRDYNLLMNRRLGGLRGEAKFQNLYAPTELPGTPISIRIPINFSRSYQADSAHKDDGAPINPDRLQPPFLKLPGFKLCYEATFNPGAGDLPYYCYLAAVQGADIEKVAGELQAQLKAKFPTTPDAWEPVDADAPSGFSVHWRRIRVNADQPFFVKTDGKVAAQTMPGIFELWIRDEGNYVVLIGWRAPSSIVGPATEPVPGAAPANTLGDRPRNVRPDLDDLPPRTAGTITSASGGAP